MKLKKWLLILHENGHLTDDELSKLFIILNSDKDCHWINHYIKGDVVIDLKNCGANGFHRFFNWDKCTRVLDLRPDDNLFPDIWSRLNGADEQLKELYDAHIKVDTDPV